MSLKFILLGCGSSFGVPRADGNWGKCNPKLLKNYRTRCSALISSNNLKILYKAAHINFYSVAPESKNSPLNVSYEALKKDGNVKLAELEIIETVPSSK